MEYLNFKIVPDETSPDCAEILVLVSLGAKTYDFLLDTGAAKTMVLSDEYTSSFQLSGEHETRGVLGAIYNDLVVIPNLIAGPIVRDRLEAVRIRQAGPHSRNLLAMDILKDYCCHFLFDENKIGFDEGKHAGLFYQLATSTKYHPCVEVSFGVIGANAVWDSGASMTVADINFINNNPQLFKQCGESQGTDPTGTELCSSEFVMAPVEIGGIAFPETRVAGVDLSVISRDQKINAHLILGYNLIDKANWIFDFPSKKFNVTLIVPMLG